MARVARAFLATGVVVALVGLVLASALQDRFVGLVLLIIGAFLMFLPYTRPHVDEDE